MRSCENGKSVLFTEGLTMKTYSEAQEWSHRDCSFPASHTPLTALPSYDGVKESSLSLGVTLSWLQACNPGKAIPRVCCFQLWIHESLKFHPFILRNPDCSTDVLGADIPCTHCLEIWLFGLSSRCYKLGPLLYCLVPCLVILLVPVTFSDFKDTVHKLFLLW